MYNLYTSDMNLKDIQVNETHVCVLRREKNQQELRVDFIELVFPYNKQLNELKRMSENRNRNVLELIDFVENSKLNVLMQSFNFCDCLSEPWQACPNITKVKSEDYMKFIDEYNQKIKEAKDEKEIAEQFRKKHNFINSQKNKFYEDINKHIIPYLLECIYKKLEDDESVLAFSHRRIGWSKPEFCLNDDLTVIYKTNFGYGASSYFYTNIRYKGIDILPYSDWIRYYGANKSEIIRYTRRHLLKNEEWIKTMHFTAELYNSMILEPNTFIEDWIISEVDEMVKGLEDLLNRNDNYEIINSYFQQKSYLALMGRDLIHFKGERIAGALDFMDKLRELKSIYSDIESYIERIMQCNLAIYPQLKNEIDLINNELRTLERKLLRIIPQWNKLNKEKEEYDIIKQEIIEELKKNPLDSTDYRMYHSPQFGFLRKWVFEEMKVRFNKRCPEYEDFLKEYNRINEVYDKLKNEIQTLEILETDFKNYRDTIYKYFIYTHRSDELTA